MHQSTLARVSTKPAVRVEEAPAAPVEDIRSARPYLFSRANLGAAARTGVPGDAPGRQQTYPVRVVVYCDDRAGMLKNLTAIISDDGTNIRSVDSRAGKDGEAIVEFIVEAEDVAHLDRIVTGLRTLPGVRDVERASKL